MLLSFNHRLDDSFRMQNSKPINSTDERTDEKKTVDGNFSNESIFIPCLHGMQIEQSKNEKKKISRPFVYVSDCNRTLMHPMIN